MFISGKLNQVATPCLQGTSGNWDSYSTPLSCRLSGVETGGVEGSVLRVLQSGNLKELGRFRFALLALLAIVAVITKRDRIGLQPHSTR